MEEDQKKDEEGQRQQQPPYISEMQPVTHEAYGGGLYGHDDEEKTKDAKEAKTLEKEKPKQHKPPASETQSADGPDETKTTRPKHKQPPSSGDRDVDITGQSYIQ